MRLAPRAALLAAAIGIPLGAAGLIYAFTDEPPMPSAPAGVHIGGATVPEGQRAQIQPMQAPAPSKSSLHPRRSATMTMTATTMRAISTTTVTTSMTKPRSAPTRGITPVA